MRLRIFYPNTLPDKHAAEIDAFMWMINTGVASTFHSCRDPFIFATKSAPWIECEKTIPDDATRFGIILNEVPAKYATDQKERFRQGLTKQLSHIILKSLSVTPPNTIGTVSRFFFCASTDPLTKENITPATITIRHDFVELAKQQKRINGRLTPLHT